MCLMCVLYSWPYVPYYDIEYFFGEEMSFSVDRNARSIQAAQARVFVQTAIQI